MIIELKYFQFKDVSGGGACTCINGHIAAIRKGGVDVVNTEVGITHDGKQARFAAGKQTVIWGGLIDKRPVCITKCCDEEGASAYRFEVYSQFVGCPPK